MATIVIKNGEKSIEAARSFYSFLLHYGMRNAPKSGAFFCVDASPRHSEYFPALSVSPPIPKCELAEPLPCDVASACWVC